MLEPFEAARAVAQLLTRPAAELDLGNFKLAVEGTPEQVKLKWSQIKLEVQDQALGWSQESPIVS